jgi:hypothetical protein
MPAQISYKINSLYNDIFRLSMFKKITIYVASALLCGCAQIDSKVLHQETISAVNSSNLALTEKLNNLESLVTAQTDYIAALESEVYDLDSKVEKVNAEIKANAHKQNMILVQKSATPIEKVIKAPQPTSQIVVLGEIEKITVDAIKESFDARVDTGAAISSINARDIEQFERNGKNWVRFRITRNAEEAPTSDMQEPQTTATTEPTKTEPAKVEQAKADDKKVGDAKVSVTPEAQLQDAQAWIEAPIVRYVRIRQASSNETSRRAVVKLWVTLGAIHENSEFSLADRSQMTNPVLLGREFMRDIAVVDVSKQYINSKSTNK